MRFCKHVILVLFGLAVGLTPVLGVARNADRSFPLKNNAWVEVKNPNGRITVKEQETGMENAVLEIVSAKPLDEQYLKISSTAARLQIELVPSDQRIDIELAVPGFARLRLETKDGQIAATGKFLYVWAETDTGTIYADTTTSDLKYKLLWTSSYPRYLSDVEVGPIKEKSAGKHVIEGLFANSSETPSAGKKSKSYAREIYLRTGRGIILLNVDPSQVPNDLLPKKLTTSAKAIIRSGDSLLVNAIRRSAPDLFGEYASTLQPHRPDPVLITSPGVNHITGNLRQVTVQVTDINNRAFKGLMKEDFSLIERGVERQIVHVSQSEEPFNLLLLIDVSGSVDNYVDFIRKAARSFVNTVDPDDRVSIVIFNDDVKPLSPFTADKDLLSKSLDTFDAGGPTALYDAIAYGLTESIRPLKGDRTAIVILSDGDDNRSFLPFDALLGSLQESGALVYPMYVPSSLIAYTGNYGSSPGLDPLRDRFLKGNLSSKAQEEGELLARVSGGVYYPISRLGELQNAYDDIVVQLRTAYTITFRSDSNDDTGGRASSKLRVKVKRKDAFVKIGAVAAIREN